MGTGAPHLLNLPREIRDIIYSYLHHEVYTQTVVAVRGQGLPLAGNTGARLLNAPLVAVLCTHSRLYTEYIEADCFRNLSATIYDSNQGYAWEPAHRSPAQRHALLQALAAVSHLKIELSGFIALEIQRFLDQGCRRLFQQLSNFKTLCIVCSGLFDEVPLHKLESRKGTWKRDELSVPASLASLSLEGHGSNFSPRLCSYNVDDLVCDLYWVDVCEYGSDTTCRPVWALDLRYGLQVEQPGYLMSRLPEKFVREWEERTMDSMDWKESA